jgi:hypothetical protein
MFCTSGTVVEVVVVVALGFEVVVTAAPACLIWWLIP